MDLTTYISRLRDELASAAELGGPDARALAERLTTPLESAFRLAMLDALSAAADEITRDLAPGSVEVRLRAGEPSFAVTPPAVETPTPAGSGVEPEPEDEPAPDEDGAMARINFRLPEHLKARIEEAAAAQGRSVNAWLVRATSAALRSASRPAPPRPAGSTSGRAPQHYTGWVG